MDSSVSFSTEWKVVSSEKPTLSLGDPSMERIGRVLRRKGEAIVATTAESPWRRARSMADGEVVVGDGGGRAGGPSTSVEDAVVTVASPDPLYRLADDLAVFAMVVKAIIEIVFAL